MTDKPLVSILLPVYNVEQYLPQCIESILNQTYTNLQVVLIDDGSKDSSLQICQSYAEKDSRVEVYKQENQGVATTRNHLLEKVNGDYVLFVDSDDWIELDMVEYLLSQAVGNKADIVTCSMVTNDTAVSLNGKKYEVWEQNKTVLEFLKHTILNGSLWNKLVRASIMEGIKFEKTISYGEDALFTWEILKNIKTLVFTDRQLYHYRINEYSLSHESWTPDKKGTGHIVWKTITQDTSELFPQYLKIANARYAIEDFWGIYFAGLSGYKYDMEIKLRQENVKKNLNNIKSSDLVSKNKYIVAYILSHCYSMGKILKHIKG